MAVPQFLRMEPLVRTRAIAAQREEALRRALGKALRKVRKENLNALEVVEVKVQKFLGWHLATLVAQARQVQISPRYGYCGVHHPAVTAEGVSSLRTHANGRAQQNL
jgi:hypothetical protein